VSHELRFSDDGAVAEIELNGPEGNSVDRAGIEALQELLADAASRERTRAVVLTGRGGTFCGGRIRDRSLLSAPEILTDLEPILETNRIIEAYPLPLIAAVEGRALGFGFGLATLCDVTVLAEDATFALTELAHGIPPLIVLSYFFRFVPYKVAFDLALTGREVDAAEALRRGLATEVAPNGATLERARAVAAHIASLRPEAISLLRRFSRRNASLIDDASATEGAGLIAELLASEG
jgi:enoyl-CoA hydratase/carnithine racemase